MSTARFMETMSAETERQCAVILQEAQNTADDIVSKARIAVAERRRFALEALARKHQLLQTQTQDRAEAEATRRSFAMQDVLVGECMKVVAESMRRMACTDEFIPVLLDLLGEALNFTDVAAPIDIYVRMEFVQSVEDYMKNTDYEHYQILTDNAPEDGVAITSDSGAFKISNTLSLRLGRIERHARSVAYRILFSESDGVLC